jgi:hypothetical protein
MDWDWPGSLNNKAIGQPSTVETTQERSLDPGIGNLLVLVEKSDVQTAGGQSYDVLVVGPYVPDYLPLRTEPEVLKDHKRPPEEDSSRPVAVAECRIVVEPNEAYPDQRRGRRECDYRRPGYPSTRNIEYVTPAL